MRNPLTRDRLRAFLGNREDIIRAFEEIAQVADTVPDVATEAQASAAIASEMATATRGDVARLTAALESLTLAVMLERSNASEVAALSRRISELEARLLAA